MPVVIESHGEWIQNKTKQNKKHAEIEYKKRVRKKSLGSCHCTVLGNLLYLSIVIVDLQAINRPAEHLICGILHISQ